MRKEYEDILGNNYLALSNIKKVRNKLEHKMHAVKFYRASSGSLEMFTISYKVNDVEITLAAIDMIKLVKQINDLFSKIQFLIDEFAFKQGKEGYSYYRKLLRYDFCNFNKLYDSDLLRTFGKTLFPF